MIWARTLPENALINPVAMLCNNHDMFSNSTQDLL